MSTETTTLAKKSPKKTFQDLVDSEQFKAQIALALPKHITPDRFVRVLMTATLKTPALLECTQESLFKSIFDAAQAGVEIDGRRAHLIPFNNHKKKCKEAQLIIDYKGIAELVMRSGVVSSIHADVVCEADEFEYDRGDVTKHKINLREERGKMYAVYCRILMRDGAAKCEVMSKRDVDRIRNRSRSSSDGPWVTDYDEMAKKTVFRRASKWVPLSPEIRTAIESEDVDDEPLNVTPKRSLAGMIGAAMESPAAVAEPGAGDEVGSEPPEALVKVMETPAARTDTPEERETILTVVQTLMLDNGVNESKVMVYAHANGLAKEGQDEVGTLSTESLDALRAIVPTLKGAK